MATIVSPPRVSPPRRTVDEQRFVIDDVNWETYVTIADALPDRHIKCTYDGSRLELMTTSPHHSSYSRLIGRFVIVLTEELGLPLRSFGDMTCRRQDRQRGLEPDECYYITNEPLIRGKMEFDFTVDPPPDLGIEVDITRSSLDRMEIYARLQVPEVWRYHEKQQAVVVYRLDSNGEYQPADASRYFPGLPMSELGSWLKRVNETDENTLLRDFRAWVRQWLTALGE